MMNHFAKIIIVTFLAGLTSNSWGQSGHSLNSILKQLHNPADKSVLVAAHRGDWRNAPENSLQAFKYAMEMGVDIIEVDLNKTKDGVIVIMHDDTIDRTTDGKGKPGDYTLEEIKKFHLKNGLGRLTAHTIPTLEEVMLLVKGKILVNLDKSYDYFEEAYQVVKTTGTLHQTIFKANATCGEVRKRYPAILDSIVFMPVVYLDRPNAKQIIDEYQQQVKPVAFELIFQKDTAAILSNNKFMNLRGSRIWMNSLWASLNAGHDDDRVSDAGDINGSWGWLIAHGAGILQTDRPQLLLQYLKKSKLR